MTNIYMGTVPKAYWLKFKHFRKYFINHDIKKWVVGNEIGKTGYNHYQVRFCSSQNLEEIRQSTIFRGGSVDKANHWVDYEKKDGRYISSDDTIEILKVRFGKPNYIQKDILKRLKTQSVREIDVWYDPDGYMGKSWLANWLYETGKGFYCPPTIDSVKGLIQFIASGYNGESVIIIDIPRSWKWSEQLYTAIESIKDGLIYDTRYHTQVRNIRGVKVLIMCNSKPKLSKLSQDRWRISEPLET